MKHGRLRSLAEGLRDKAARVETDGVAGAGGQRCARCAIGSVIGGGEGATPSNHGFKDARRLARAPAIGGVLPLMRRRISSHSSCRQFAEGFSCRASRNPVSGLVALA